jgi:hypothetical protein
MLEGESKSKRYESASSKVRVGPRSPTSWRMAHIYFAASSQSSPCTPLDLYRREHRPLAALLAAASNLRRLTSIHADQPPLR